MKLYIRKMRSISFIVIRQVILCSIRNRAKTLLRIQTISSLSINYQGLQHPKSQTLISLMVNWSLTLINQFFYYVSEIIKYICNSLHDQLFKPALRIIYTSVRCKKKTSKLQLCTYNNVYRLQRMILEIKPGFKIKIELIQTGP